MVEAVVVEVVGEVVEVEPLSLKLLDHTGGLTRTDLPGTHGEDGSEGYALLTSSTIK